MRVAMLSGGTAIPSGGIAILRETTDPLLCTRDSSPSDMFLMIYFKS